MVLDVKEAVGGGSLTDLLRNFKPIGKRRGEEGSEGDDGEFRGKSIARWVGEDGAGDGAVAGG